MQLHSNNHYRDCRCNKHGWIRLYPLLGSDKARMARRSEKNMRLNYQAQGQRETPKAEKSTLLSFLVSSLLQSRQSRIHLCSLRPRLIYLSNYCYCWLVHKAASFAHHTSEMLQTWVTHSHRLCHTQTSHIGKNCHANRHRASLPWVPVTTSRPHSFGTCPVSVAVRSQLQLSLPQGLPHRYHLRLL
jgi:hypothetical protein